MPTRRLQIGHIHVENVLAIERDLAFQPGVAQRFVDPVQGAQKRGLAAARRADQRGDLGWSEVQMRCRAAPGTLP